jgi:hypothetical protein
MWWIFQLSIIFGALYLFSLVPDADDKLGRTITGSQPGRVLAIGFILAWAFTVGIVYFSDWLRDCLRERRQQKKSPRRVASPRARSLPRLR